MARAKLSSKDVRKTLQTLSDELEPFEVSSEGAERNLYVFSDARTGAHFCECHVKGSKLIQFGTVDVPLDPAEQSEYRANREIVETSSAFEKMKKDAKSRRSFSNIVAEYSKEFDEEHPLKIIGGQHRFEAIRLALEAGVDEYHGVKIYLALDMDQRLDVQLISNTNIATSGDLFDRMQETVRGPGLRDWCQSVGLLKKGVDFADKRERGGPISVQLARTFVLNFYVGQQIDPAKFEQTDTTPHLCASGEADELWEELIAKRPNLWNDVALVNAGKQFARLVSAQRTALKGRHGTPPDYPEKALNAAIVASWAYVAGMLQKNSKRLQRHFGLADTAGRDPLNATILAAGKHKTDPDNYRGLGYRTDAKERGRFVELFYFQAEDGHGVRKSSVDTAIASYHAKRAVLEAQKVRAKAVSA